MIFAKLMIPTVLFNSCLCYNNSIYPRISTFLKPYKYIRLSKHRELLSKGCTPNWNNKIFTITKRQITNLVTYFLKDFDREEIRRGFYVQKLQKVIHRYKTDIWRIIFDVKRKLKYM